MVQLPRGWATHSENYVISTLEVEVPTQGHLHHSSWRACGGEKVHRGTGQRQVPIQSLTSHEALEDLSLFAGSSHQRSLLSSIVSSKSRNTSNTASRVLNVLCDHADDPLIRLLVIIIIIITPAVVLVHFIMAMMGKVRMIRTEGFYKWNDNIFKCDDLYRVLSSLRFLVKRNMWYRRATRAWDLCQGKT